MKRVALKGFYRRWLESDPQPIEHPTRILPHVAAVLELAEVFRQVLLRDPDVGSADRPFQDQPEDFDAVGMIQTAHIFLRPMADPPMGVSHGRQCVADLPFVCADMHRTICRRRRSYEQRTTILAIRSEPLPRKLLAGRQATKSDWSFKRTVRSCGA